MPPLGYPSVTSPAFILRHATVNDAEFLFALRTDPDVVAASHTLGPPDLDHHIAWLTKALTLEDRVLYIVTDGAGEPIGQVRLDIADMGRYGEVSIALVKAARGKGLGTGILREVARRAKEEHRLGWLEAVIKESNTASRRAFLNAGYTVEEIKDGLVHMAKYLAQ